MQNDLNCIHHITSIASDPLKADEFSPDFWALGE
jgi:hypothetical protein